MQIKDILAGEPRRTAIYSHGQELFYKFVSKITNKLVKQGEFNDFEKVFL